MSNGIRNRNPGHDPITSHQQAWGGYNAAHLAILGCDFELLKQILMSNAATNASADSVEKLIRDIHGERARESRYFFLLMTFKVT